MDEFETFSAEIGATPELVQGAGGNTSIKEDGVLRVKASGAWLKDALARNIFVRVDLASMREATVGDFDDESLKDALRPLGDEVLRPSIETPLHALAPHKIVAHVHSANAIAISIRKDAELRLASLLDGVDWALVPYERPGAPLAKAVREIFRTRSVSALFLGNHGLVLGADSVAEMRTLLVDVERRLTVPISAIIAPAPATRSAAPQGYHWLDSSPASFLAFDDARRAAVSKGSLYPDHVVFLGPGLMIAETAAEAAAAGAKIAVVPHEGVIARKDLTAGAVAMVDSLGLVAARIDPVASINYLTEDDERALLGWDAETYRQALDRRMGRQ